jgi:hypothetical protein
LSNVISLFQVDDEPCDDIVRMRLLYYNPDVIGLKELIISSLNYSFITGGF